jgi:predicted phosphodiesterase
MRVGLLADAHGNSVALRACLAELKAMRPDRVYFLGDAVGYLPDATGCLALLEASRAVCQQGNHEAMLLAGGVSPEREEVYRLGAARQGLGSAQLAEISEWPASREVTLGSRRLLFVHGSPQEPLTGYVYSDRDPASHLDPAYDAIVMGHTHRPFSLEVGERLMLNVGSVGLPRDVGDLASFAVYDSATGEASIYRVGFDRDEVLARWGDEIHEQTAACLARASDAFVGERIA